MSLPNPPLDLTGHCSTIYNNTLYIYSPAGFQSLPLQQNATWSVLPPGISVTGGECVKAVPPSDPSQAGLYIVGGVANSSTSSYSGLQKFGFESGTWQTITPQVTVTQNRQNHGATYLNQTDQILVYAGTQGGQEASNALSTQTFLISASPPYSVLSFNSAAPPVTDPMLMPFDEARALLVGGAPDNTEVWTFGETQEWANLGVTLPEGIEYQNTTQCVLVTGDDGSKVLEMFDMGTIPNNVTNFVLLTASGAPGSTGQTVGGPPLKTRKRDLTLDGWPTYNGTFAPTVTRADYHIADSPDGLIVITGGNSANPIAMFDSKENSWLNATEALGGAQVPLQTSSLPSVSVVQPASTSSPTSTSSSFVIPNANPPKSKTLTVLGGTLGAVFALAAILIIILVLLKWQKDRKREKSKSYINEKNDDRLSFADQGAEFMHEAGGSVGRRYSQSLNSSVTSLQIFQNRGKGAKNGHRRGLPSDELPIVKNKSPLGMSEPMEMSQMSDSPRTSPTGSRRLNPTPEAHVQNVSSSANQLLSPSTAVDSERSRSTGWSTYFANNDITNLASMRSPNRDTVETMEPSFRTSEFSRSDYNDSSSRLAAAGVKPLELNLGPKFDGQRLSMSKVASGSPTINRSSEDLARARSAQVGQWNPEGATGSSSAPASRWNNEPPTTASTSAPNSRWTNEPSTIGSTPTANTFVFSITGDKSRTDANSDTASVSSRYSANTNPFFTSGVNPYHMNDPTSDLFKNGRKSSGSPVLRPTQSPTLRPTNSPVLRPRSNLSIVTDADKNSRGSAVAVFSGANSLGSPKFPPKPMASKAAGVDFPMPKAYFGNNQARDSGASNVTVFPRGVPSSPTASTFGPSAIKPKLVEARSPPTSTYGSIAQAPPAAAAAGSQRKGPVIRKTTGDEDMSWLNINAGR